MSKREGSLRGSGKCSLPFSPCPKWVQSRGRPLVSSWIFLSETAERARAPSPQTHSAGCFGQVSIWCRISHRPPAFALMFRGSRTLRAFNQAGLLARSALITTRSCHLERLNQRCLNNSELCNKRNLLGGYLFEFHVFPARSQLCGAAAGIQLSGSSSISAGHFFRL